MISKNFKMLLKFSHFFNSFLRISVAILCLLLLGALFLEVVNRYIFYVSWGETQYLIIFCFAWLCMLGAALAVREKKHFEVDLLASLLPPKLAFFHRIFIIISILLAGVVICYSSIGFVELGFFKKNPATDFPMFYVYASLFVGGLLIILFALEELLLQIFSYNKNIKS
jgi:TRAP-type C4-dicarboxylate transport system permease small subunit